MIGQSSGLQSPNALCFRLILDNNNKLMFDKQKIKDLQQRSHVRGLLSKQFYHNEQMELERKRKEMKNELDRQVQERRRLKQQQKLEQERKIKKEEEEIKNYYKKLQNREKRISANQSNLPNMKQAAQPYLTYPNENYQDSRAKPVQPSRNRGNSKPTILIDGDIPLLPVMPQDNTAPASFQSGQGLANSKSNVSGFNSGAIPLLDLSQQQNNYVALKSKKGKKTKRQKTLEVQQKESQIEKIHGSRPQDRYASNNERRSTIPDQESIVGSLVRAHNSVQKKALEPQGGLKEIEQVQYENNSLKMQLRKNQEAISLLMGALRSNTKLDKYRIQAQRILAGNQNMQASIASKKEEQKKDQGALMLPRIQLKHQSIMHDYLISAARRGKKSLGK